MPLDLIAGWNITSPDPIDTRHIVTQSSDRFGFSFARIHTGLATFESESQQYFILSDSASYTNSQGWSKIYISDPGGANLTISGSLFVGSGSVGSITASNDISASGYISSSGLVVDGVISASSYEGISATLYKTGSDTNDSTNLGLFQIKNFDTEVFLTASGDQLVIQFGVPKIPTNLSATFNGTFNDDRFSGPGAGSYVIDDDYDIVFTYTLDDTNTFLSASILSKVGDGGVDVEVSSSDDGDGNTTFNVGNSDYITSLHSGSVYFTASVFVELQDGSQQSFETYLEGILDKDDPTNPTYTFSAGTFPSAYINNLGSSTSNSSFERGATGNLTYTSASGNDDGWTLLNISSNDYSPVVIDSSTTTKTVTITSNYSNGGLGTPNTPDGTINRSKTFNRIVSLRHGASLNSASFTEAELDDLDEWTGGSEVQDGTVAFNTGTSTIDNIALTITNASSAYLYIIHKSSISDITLIKQGTTDVTDGWIWTDASQPGQTESPVTVGDYKIYRTKDLNGAGAKNFTLNPPS